MNLDRTPSRHQPASQRSLAAVIAWRYLTGSANTLSAVSVAAVLGLSLSVAVLIIVLSVMNGFEAALRERILGVVPHATVWLERPATTDPQREAVLASAAGVTGIAPIIEEAALASGPEKVAGVLVTGIDPERHVDVSDLHDYLVPAGAHLEAGRFQAWIGSRLARQLGVEIGDSISLVLPVPQLSPVGLLPRQRRFEVTALIETRSELDSRAVFVHIADAGRLFRIGGRVAGYQLRLEDLFATGLAYDAAAAAFGDQVASVRPWTRAQGNLYQAIVTQKVTMFVLLSFLVAVAAFNLVSGLVMVAEQKRADVAILRSMGSGTSMVLWLFFLLGLLLGATGLILGVIAGLLITLAVPGLPALAADLSGRDVMSQYFIDYLPVDIRSDDVVIIVGISLFLVILSSLYPAWKATRQRPVEVLAHE